MNAYVLIGSPNTRKSSICRALTGCFAGNIREIRTQNGKTLRLYVRVTALQETKTSPADYIEEAKEKAVRHVLFSLWPHQRLDDPAQFPDAQGYLEYFVKHGWQVSSIAILGQSSAHLDPDAIGIDKLVNHPRSFPNTFIDPVNLSAAGIRKHFGWV